VPTSNTDQVTRSGAESARRALPALLLLFVGSGCAALIYEIVWFQMLQLVIGSTGISLGVLLGTFMGGMCLGSLALPKYVPMDKHPLRVYAYLELGIAAFGLLLLALIPLVGGIYTSLLPHGPLSIFLRAIICALLLIPPTVLMGATLPAISRFVETTPNGVSWMGFFYGGNIGGAVIGCLLAGFYLLRVFDLWTATFVAMGFNIAVALIALALAKSAEYGGSKAEGSEMTPVFDRQHRLVFIAIALSGMTALGAEVIWARLLSLLLGASVYTFSIILAVFLVGLGIGSGFGSYLARSLRNPKMALGICQFAVVAGLAWTAVMLTQSLPNWPINPSITEDAWFLFQMDIARTMWAILPATFFWGASFPLAVAAAASKGQDPGRLMGSIYAANTIGAILGAVGFSVILIPMFGTQVSQRFLIGLATLSALIMIVPGLLEARAASEAKSAEGGPKPSIFPIVWVGAAVAVAIFMARSVSPVPPVLVAYGRYAPTYYPPNALYVGEGMNSSIAVTELDNGVRNFHVSGKIEASTEPQDMRLQRMLGHISALAHPAPKSVLIVGFGAGVTAGTFVLHPGIERIVICEIEPLIPEIVAQYFGDENYNVLDDPRVEVIYDDARHYIRTTDETFDVITSDPIHPWVKGAASLYTQEYFDLARQHLNPGGVMTQWVPLYESEERVVKSEIGTFMNVFPQGTIWSNDINGEGYDVVVVGQNEPTVIDVDALQDRLLRPEYVDVAISLREVGFNSALDLLGTYAGRGTELAPWLVDAEINRDRNLRLMYIAGLGMNLYQQGSIYDAILQYRDWPEGLFVGEPARVETLRAMLGG